MKEIFTQIDGNWHCDFKALEIKTDKMFSVLEVGRIFKRHKEHIKLVDVSEGETYINILILTTGICYELLYKKDTKESSVSSVTASAIDRIVKALKER